MCSYRSWDTDYTLFFERTEGVGEQRLPVMYLPVPAAAASRGPASGCLRWQARYMVDWIAPVPHHHRSQPGPIATLPMGMNGGDSHAALPGVSGGGGVERLMAGGCHTCHLLFRELQTNSVHYILAPSRRGFRVPASAQGFSCLHSTASLGGEDQYLPIHGNGPRAIVPAKAGAAAFTEGPWPPVLAGAVAGDGVLGVKHVAFDGVLRCIGKPGMPVKSVTVEHRPQFRQLVTESGQPLAFLSPAGRQVIAGYSCQAGVPVEGSHLSRGGLQFYDLTDKHSFQLRNRAGIFRSFRTRSARPICPVSFGLHHPGRSSGHRNHNLRELHTRRSLRDRSGCCHRPGGAVGGFPPRWGPWTTAARPFWRGRWGFVTVGSNLLSSDDT